MDDYNFDVPDGMDLMRPTAHRLSRSEMTVDVETMTVDIRHDVRNLP